MKTGRISPSGVKAFSIEEIVISMALTSLAISGIISGYLLSARRAEWSAYSSAATAAAVQRWELTRAAKWDLIAYPPVDELVQSNFPPENVVLNLPAPGTNLPAATLLTTISSLSANPPLKSVRIDCIWTNWNQQVVTNTLQTFRSPDQ